MVVEDEPMVGELLAEALDGWGLEVLRQRDPTTALHWPDDAAADAPDLLITDQAMPRLTGLALTQRLRRRHPDLPVLLCTSNAVMLPPDALKRLGIQAHKPIDARRRRELVQRCLAMPRS
jgi:DNA-binding NtrC family response regulator